MDCLYLEQEREQRLDKGFRAHPSVGAAVLVSQTETRTSAFWDSVSKSIQAARQADDVRIFLLGSIFGGTGAAGFPTIARLIKKEVGRQANKAAYIGGALMLPYFKFPMPPHRSGELLPDSSAFIEETQGALSYYSRLLTEEKLFDHLYLIGWEPLLEIGGYSEGGPEQRNPALIPELVAALTALQYFARDGAGGGTVQYFTTAAEHRVGWDDLPPIGTGGPDQVRQRLGALIRFAHAYHAIYRPALTQDEWRAVRREAWYRRLIGRKAEELFDAPSQRLLDLMDTYCAELLRWAASIVFGASDAGDVRLYQAAQFAVDEPGDPFDRAKLRGARQVNLGSFGGLIEGEGGPDLPTIFDRLTYNRFAGGEGFGVFLRALHQACNARLP